MTNRLTNRRMLLSLSGILCMLLMVLFSGCVHSTLIVDWKRPKSGMTPAYFEQNYPPVINCASTTCQYEIVSWTEEAAQRKMNPQTDTFKIGESYLVVLLVTVPNNISISKEDAVSTTKGYLASETRMPDADHVEMHFRFNLTDGDPTNTDVLKVDCAEISEETAPAKVSETFTVYYNNKKQTFAVEEWRMYDPERLEEGTVMDKNAAFEIGHAYSALLTLDPPHNFAKDYTNLNCPREAEMAVKDGKIRVQVYFTSLAVRIVPSDIVIDAPSLVQGSSILDMNEQVHVVIGGTEVSGECTWYTERAGIEEAMLPTDLLQKHDGTLYVLDVTFPVSAEVLPEEFTLQVLGTAFAGCSGLQTYPKNDALRGFVRILYDASELPSSEEERQNAAMYLSLPRLTEEMTFRELQQLLLVQNARKDVENPEIHWTLCCDDGYYSLDDYLKDDAAKVARSYTIAGETHTPRAYRLEVSFPAANPAALNRDDAKEDGSVLLTDCPGTIAQWYSYGTDVKTGAGICTIQLLIDADAVRPQAPDEPVMKGIEDIFFYCPEVLAGIPVSDASERIVIITGGHRAADPEVQWSQNRVDGDGLETIELSSEDVFRPFGKEDSAALCVTFPCTVQGEAPAVGVYGSTPLPEVTLHEDGRCTLMIEKMEPAVPYIVINVPTTRVNGEISYDYADYSAFWSDPYLQTEVDLWLVEWYAALTPFGFSTVYHDEAWYINPGNLADGDYTYRLDVYMKTPESREGNQLNVHVFAGPHPTLSSFENPSDDLVLWGQTAEMVVAHVSVDPLSDGSCEHVFVLDEEQSTPATCSDPGTDVYVCEKCGEILRENTAAAGHSWQKLEDESTDADCQHTGLAVYVCSVCGEGMTETVAKVPHNMVVSTEESVSASCTHSGQIVRYCTFCGVHEIEYIPQLAHNFTYTPNNDNTHNYACSNGCDSISKEVCTPGENGNCIYCGAPISE